jgi:hypothetical protein
VFQSAIAAMVAAEPAKTTPFRERFEQNKADKGDLLRGPMAREDDPGGTRSHSGLFTAWFSRLPLPSQWSTVIAGGQSVGEVFSAQVYCLGSTMRTLS